MVVPLIPSGVDAGGGILDTADGDGPEPAMPPCQQAKMQSRLGPSRWLRLHPPKDSHPKRQLTIHVIKVIFWQKNYALIEK